ncbi:Gldg family protein [Alistipes sp.]|uniref:Gldg family protein n=1 Tax=Alistipes sp. TaxID=1872444 RepID=UPI003AEF5AFC
MNSNNSLRSTLRIARIELNTLFYSPVAWLVLVIFAFQVGMTFSNVMDQYIHNKIMDYGMYGVTGGLFTGMRGLFPKVTNYLYLYIPLISMGLMSREYASGSIKLLFSSPVSNRAIILGKYLAILVYGLALMAVLALYVFYAWLTVEHFDAPMVWTGMLGIFLLLCTYSAIGLFMSTITSYQVVAGVGTLAVLAALNYVGEIGQGTAFVRDITYWLSISGRVYEFIAGMIPSEALIYFVALIVFFLTLSVFKLDTDRAERNPRRTWLRYGGAVACLVAVAFVSSRPACKFYLDTTYTQSNTLADESIEVMERLTGPMTITTYVNLLDKNAFNAMPRSLKRDFERFEKYTRFKPEIRMKYVYYWADCGNNELRSRYPNRTDEELAELVCNANYMDFKGVMNKEQIDRIIDLRPEGYRFLRVVEYGEGQRAVLRMFEDMNRHPDEAEISAAFKRFIEPSPRVAIVSGHGDRTMDNPGSRGYNLFSHNLTFRNSLINQGFTPEEFDLGEGEIPSDIDILVLADLKTPLSAAERDRLDAYLARGGNMYLLCDVTRAGTMNPVVRQLGIEFGDEILVAPAKDQDPTLLPAVITEEAAQIYPRFDKLRNYGVRMGLTGAVEIRLRGADSLFRVLPLLKSDEEGVWNERETTDFIEDSAVYNPAAGERQREYLLGAALSRRVGDKEQRIVVLGDADCISNDGLAAQYWFGASNYTLIDGAFRWMSYNQFPIDTTHPDYVDNDISLGKPARKWNKWGATALFPGLLLLAGILLIVKRQRG